MTDSKNETLTPGTETHTSTTKNSTLKNSVVIVLQTALAQRLIHGTWQYHRMGLKQFDQAMRQLWLGAKGNDPYADWFLLKTYDAYRRAQKTFQNMEQQCKTILQNLRGFEVTVCSNDQPQKYTLSFKTPFGNMGATLLSDLDYLLCSMVTVKRLGLAHQLQALSVQHLVDTLQTVFETPRAWRHSNLTRDDLLAGTEKALAAKARWGELPPAIFKRSIKFAYWPLIISGVPLEKT